MSKLYSGLSTIIVNWNLGQATVACIQSLEIAGFPVSQVIVVDNGSTDTSLETIRRNTSPLLQIITLPTNMGFASGSNLGIKKALQQDAEWIFLLNNDAVVEDTFFEKIWPILEERPADILSPLIMYYEDRNKIWHAGDHLIPGTLLTRSLWRNRKVPESLPVVIPVDFVTACGVFIHREVFQKIGLLATGFFMYGEDVEFCWRAKQAGFSIACVTSTRLYHRVSLSTRDAEPKRRYFRTRNQIWFYRLYAKEGILITTWFLSSLRLLRIALRDALHNDFPALLASIRGWFDGWWRPLDKRLLDKRLKEA